MTLNILITPYKIHYSIWQHFFPLYIFTGFVYTEYLCRPFGPLHGTVPSQAAVHLMTDRVCRVLGRSWIRTQDYWFPYGSMAFSFLEISCYHSAIGIFLLRFLASRVPFRFLRFIQQSDSNLFWNLIFSFSVIKNPLERSSFLLTIFKIPMGF